jgi:RAMA domain-containing protein
MSKKRLPLVSQYLENISRRMLEEYQDSIREYVRRRHGVYALYRRGRLYYVGLAGNLRNRLHHHIRDRHSQSWDRFSVYLTIGDSHIRELELLVLRIVSPPGNRVKGKFARAENLKNRLSAEIRKHYRLEFQELFGSKRISKQDKKPLKFKPIPKGRQPVLGKYKNRPSKIKAKYKGKTIRASVLKNGAIRFQSTVYNSPSLAGAAAVGHRTCNGWTFWQYERAPGDWVPLNNLKR